MFAKYCGVALTLFNSALACSPDTAALLVITMKLENGAPEKHDNPNIRIL
jgi:hypothetical protein